MDLGGAPGQVSAMMSRLAFLLAVAAVLAGCASAPRVETQRSAAVPASVTAYRLVEVEAPTQDDRAAAQAVRQALAARGWREAADAAGWRVETAYAVRPQKTGVFTDVDARQGEWTDAPRLPQWWSQGRRTHSLTVILTGPGDEAGTYRASAVAVLGRRQADRAPGLLAEAAVAQLGADG